MSWIQREPLRPGWLLATLAVLGLAVSWPVTDSLALHMLQHIGLISVVPLMLLRGAPGLVAGSALSITQGVCLVLAGILAIYAAHVPAVFETDLGATAPRVLLHLWLLAAGLLLSVPISGARCVVGIAGVALVALAELGIGALGMWLAWIPELVYSLPDGAEPRFGLSAGTDQSLSGAFLLVLAEPLLAFELLFLFFRALDDPEEEAFS